jgi:hypothetical protein
MIHRISSLVLGLLLLVTGAATFGAHQLYLEPGQRAPFVREAIERYYADAPSADIPLNERIEDLYSCEDQIWTILVEYERQAPRGRIESREQTAGLLERISSHLATIESGDVTANDYDQADAARIAKLVDLRASFAAVQLAPGLHQERFRSRAKDLITDSSQSESAVLASYLGIVNEHDYSAPVTTDCRSDLLRFASRFPENRFGPMLFSTISSRFWQSHQSDSATQVLELAVETYRGQSSMGVLISQLANQQLPQWNENDDANRPAIDWRTFAEMLDPTRTWNISPMR